MAAKKLSRSNKPENKLPKEVPVQAPRRLSQITLSDADFRRMSTVSGALSSLVDLLYTDQHHRVSMILQPLADQLMHLEAELDERFLPDDEGGAR